MLSVETGSDISSLRAKSISRKRLKSRSRRRSFKQPEKKWNWKRNVRIFGATYLIVFFLSLAYFLFISKQVYYFHRTFDSLKERWFQESLAAVQGDKQKAKDLFEHNFQVFEHKGETLVTVLISDGQNYRELVYRKGPGFLRNGWYPQYNVVNGKKTLKKLGHVLNDIDAEKIGAKKPEFNWYSQLYV